MLIRGSPRLAIASDRPGVQLSAMQRIRPASFRAICLHQLAIIGIRLGLDRVLFRQMDDPFRGQFDMDAWLSEVGMRLNTPSLFAAILWPANPARQRVYVHLMDATGEHVGFAKVSLDVGNDKRLVREGAALESLRVVEWKYAYAPKVLDFASFRGRRYLVLESLPRMAQPVCFSDWRDYPAMCVNEFAGQLKRLDSRELESLGWWRVYHTKQQRPLVRTLAAAADKGVRACRVHGDFQSHNCMYVDGRLWIFDWERSHPCGPHLTDAVTAWLEIHQTLVKKDPKRACATLLDHFCIDSNSAAISIHDIAPALAFLDIKGFAAARLLSSYWNDVISTSARR